MLITGRKRKEILIDFMEERGKKDGRGKNERRELLVYSGGCKKGVR